MRAQIIGTTFIYILSIIVMALVLLYGYRAISSSIKTQEQISLISAESAIDKKIQEVGSQYDRVEQAEISVPQRFQALCFVDLSADNQQTRNICMPASEDYNPIICDMWTENAKKNVFFVESKSKVTSYYLEGISIDSDNDGAEDTSECINPDCFYICVNVEANGKATFWLRGTGKTAAISTEAPG